MSLRVWLPMTKDLRNQGLLNVTVTNYGATLDNNGKLGKCYYFDGTDDAIGIGDLNNICPDGNFSFACWFYKSEFSSKGYDTIFGGPSGFELETKNGTTNSNVIVPWNWGKPQIAYEFDKWYHLVMTRTSSGTTYYLNGEQVATGTAGTIPAGNYFIGAWNTATQQNYKGKLNDVRIYDHCLSPMEVKELAKGLVLHYPLNRGGWGQENLFLNSGDLTKWNVETGIEISFDTEEQMYKIVDTTHSNDSRWGIYQNFQVLPNTTYTFSIEGKAGTSNTTAGIFTYESNTAWPSPVYTFTSTKSKCIHTFTTGNNHTVGRVYLGVNTSSGNKTAWYKFPKLELGSVATPWTPNSSDTLATAMGLNGTTEYDTSGHCNNGTRTGTFNWTSDTPKYSVSTKFNGTEKISADSLPSEVQSVSFWVKVSTIPSGYGICYVDSNTQTSIGFYNGNSFITSCTVSANVVLLGTTFKANEWNHIVLIKTGANTRNVYCNGILLTNSGTNSWVHNGSNLSLGWRDYASGNAGWFNGQLCDFRAYATALSAADVKSLYQNSAYIDSSGNVYGAVHTEV